MQSAQRSHSPLNAPIPGAGLIEKDTIVEDECGYRMELHELSFRQIQLKWGKYNAPREKVLSFCPDTTTVISHFRITDPSAIVNENRERIAENQFVVYQEKPGTYDLHISPTRDKSCHFFEAGMSDTLFRLLFNEDSDFLSRFSSHVPLRTPALDFTASILPQMHTIINDMYHAKYQGHLRDLYLEAKTIELFLLQISQLDRQGYPAQLRLRKQDVDCLHGIRQHIESNFDQPMSITSLSRMAGINSMKLKTGFKQLFNTTVFGYLHDIRMQEAKRLLLDENKPVNEVADAIGYKHPHHFAAAFKKQFNVTPSQLRK